MIEIIKEKISLLLEKISLLLILIMYRDEQ